jgi:hypothetical protein
VPIEEQVLPNAALKGLYDKVVWVWVYRDFKNGPADLAAERVHNRCGVSSWPHLLFVNSSWEVLVESGRTTDAVQSAASRAMAAAPKGRRDPALDAALAKARDAIKAGRKDEARAALKKIAAGKDDGEYALEARDVLEEIDGRPAAGAKDLADGDADRRADALDALPASPFAKEALALLEDKDADVRMRAVKYVARAAPEKLAPAAAKLLADPVDAVKHAALAGLQGTKEGAAAIVDAWKALDAGRIESRNPNVLRGRLAAAMGESAGEEAVPLLGAFAAKAEFLNGTTHTCVKSLGQIGRRTKSAAAAQVLVEAFPRAVTKEDAAKKVEAHVVRLAKGVHEALVEATGNKSVTFPSAWDEASRAGLVKAWRESLK